MTGTGNSYTVARWCAEAAETVGLCCKLIQIKAGEKAADIPPNSLVLFTYPTHGFTAPWLMLKYIWRLPAGHKQHVIVMPNRAGIRVKGVFLPGLEGTAGYLIALLLWFRGYQVRGVMGVDMPSNWTAVHWGLSRQNSASIMSMSQSKVKSMFHAILNGDKHFDGIVQLCLGLALARISLMYMIMAQFILSKLFFASDKCNGCAICQKICPKNALKMAGKPQRPYWTYSCDSCMACMNYCPEQAIEVSPLIVSLLYYIVSIPVLSFALQYLGEGYVVPSYFLPSVGFSLQYAYTLGATALAYSFLHFALGSRLLRFVAAKLSHTHYYRRYKAEAVSLKDIHR